MKRGAKRWRLVIAALALVSLSAAAQQAGAPGAAASAPQEQKNGTGVVPPGVKLSALDAGCWRAQGVSFSAGGHENSAEWLASLRGDRPRRARPSPPAW